MTAGLKRRRLKSIRSFFASRPSLELYETDHGYSNSGSCPYSLNVGVKESCELRIRCFLRTSPLRSSWKLALRVDLLLYHRFGRLKSGNGVCMPMHDLPLTLLRTKDHRGPQSKRGYILPPAYLGLSLIYHNYVGKVSSYMLLYDLDAHEFAISASRCCLLRGLNNLLPSMRDTPIEVSERYVISTGPQLQHRLGVSFEELIHR